MCAEGAGALWRSGYRLEDALRPPFIPPALALKLLRAGKSLNFLRCGPCGFAALPLLYCRLPAAGDLRTPETGHRTVTATFVYLTAL